MKWQAWAFVDVEGVICASSEWQSPAEVFKCCLGWPYEQKIEAAKARSCRAVQVTIEEVEG